MAQHLAKDPPKVILEPACFCPDHCFLNSHIGHDLALGSGWISWAEEPESIPAPTGSKKLLGEPHVFENLNKFLGEPPSSPRASCISKRRCRSKTFNRQHIGQSQRAQ